MVVTWTAKKKGEKNIIFIYSNLKEIILLLVSKIFLSLFIQTCQNNINYRRLLNFQNVITDENRHEAKPNPSLI